MDQEALDAPDDGVANTSGFRAFIARAESVYLAILRVATLLIATGIIIYLGWLLLAGTYNISRDAGSVHEEPVTVTAQEIADMSTAPASGEASSNVLAQEANEADGFYSDFLKRYHALFANSFERYKQKDDPSLTLQQFDEKYLNTAGRKQAEKDGSLSFAADRDDLKDLLSVMQEAAALPTTKSHLMTYQKTPKQKVEKKVQKTRMESYCTYFSDYTGDCLLTDTRPVDYTDTEVTFALPKGVFSHQELFGRYQDNYLKTIVARRQASQSKASNERTDILEANVHGKQQLQTAIFAAGSFLALMFFFLLIAIERHQRKIARNLH